MTTATQPSAIQFNSHITELQKQVGKDIVKLSDNFDALTDADAQMQFIQSLNANVMDKLTKYWAMRVAYTNKEFQKEAELKSQRINNTVKENIQSGKPFIALELPPHSMGQAIQEAKKSGKTYKQTLDILSQICIQIVGTEHPTDELSQEANNQLAKLANLPVGDDASTITSELLKTTLIPDNRRTLGEEVRRNLHKVSAAIHKGRPEFAKDLHFYMQAAYKKEYNPRDINSITSRMVMSVNWAGIESDGNTEITPEITAVTFGIGSEEAAKHHGTTVQGLTEEIDQLLNQGIAAYLNQLLTMDEPEPSKRLSRMMIQLDPSTTLLMPKFKEDLVKIKKQLNAYQVTTQDDRYNLTIAGESADKYLENRYKELKEKYSPLFQAYPTIREKFRNFGQDIENFSMHYTLFEGRHKSDDHRRVWGIIIDDLSTINSEQFRPWLESRNLSGSYSGTYATLKEEQKVPLFLNLLDGSKESGKLLKLIHDKYESNYYLRRQEELSTFLRNGQELAQGKLYGEAHRELKRHKIFKHFEDRIPVVINSNTEQVSDIFLREGFLALFDLNNKINVPLFESKNDIEKSLEKVLDQYSSFKIQYALEKAFNWESQHERNDLKQLLGIDTKDDIAPLLAEGRAAFNERVKASPAIRLYLVPVVAQLMLGYSDSERESGIGALPSVQKGIEKATGIFEEWGLDTKQTRPIAEQATTAKVFPGKAYYEQNDLQSILSRRQNQSGLIFRGNGGDANRMGKGLAPEKGTLQGEARDALFGTPVAVQRYLNRCFYNAFKQKNTPESVKRIASLSEKAKQLLDRFEEASTQSFEQHLDEKKGFGKAMAILMPRLGDYMVQMTLNSSSRATLLGVNAGNGDRFKPLKEGGPALDKVANIAKWRAITQGQAFEFLPLMFSLTGGIGAGMIALPKGADHLYRSSEDFRDVVMKAAQGVARTNFALIRQTALPGQAPLTPQQFKEGLQRAKQLPQQLKECDINELLKKAPETANQVISDYLCLLEEQHNNARDGLVSLLRTLYPLHMREYKQPIDLLLPWPELHLQQSRKNKEALGLQTLASFIISRENNGQKLDALYHDHTNSILGNMASGINQGRVAPPASYDPLLGADVTRMPSATVTTLDQLKTAERRNASPRIQAAM